ncbi:hypothetical protein BU23DRAFT_79562 [Bimuria novae-zelandiae CBS 107.79]|uniref:Uncharacterized protein n=1 Tax=Bimuria novae-zelandiae CBS 107.79 TaxID=1447943 RepID=A0A6A5VEE9_9PLEO|nr:hypothetical protein BU23DRAFT_79562 [Bimuria novae-zelandiae CBS 107.79]
MLWDVVASAQFTRSYHIVHPAPFLLVYSFDFIARYRFTARAFGTVPVISGGFPACRFCELFLIVFYRGKKTLKKSHHEKREGDAMNFEILNYYYIE